MGTTRVIVGDVHNLKSESAGRNRSWGAGRQSVSPSGKEQATV